MQLDIFTEASEISSMVWERIEQLDFATANELLEEGLSKYPDEELLLLSRSRAQDWLFLLTPALSAKELLQRVIEYPFTSDWGDNNLRTSLLKRVVAMAEQSTDFRIGESHDLSDVYLLLGDHISAEVVLENYSDKHQNDLAVLIKLANLQRTMGKISASNLLYMKAIFVFHDKINIKTLEYPVLQKLAEKHSLPMCLPWSVVHGENIPLAAAREYTQHPDTEVRKAALACTAMAEDQAARARRVSSVEARKSLAECDRDLFKAYMEFMQSGNPLNG